MSYTYGARTTYFRDSKTLCTKIVTGALQHNINWHVSGGPQQNGLTCKDLSESCAHNSRFITPQAYRENMHKYKTLEWFIPQSFFKNVKEPFSSFHFQKRFFVVFMFWSGTGLDLPQNSHGALPGDFVYICSKLHIHCFFPQNKIVEEWDGMSSTNYL